MCVRACVRACVCYDYKELLKYDHLETCFYIDLTYFEIVGTSHDQL